MDYQNFLFKSDFYIPENSSIFVRKLYYVGKMNSKSVVARVIELELTSAGIAHHWSKPLLLLCLLSYFFLALATAQIMMPQSTVTIEAAIIFNTSVAQMLFYYFADMSQRDCVLVFQQCFHKQQLIYKNCVKYIMKLKADQLCPRDYPICLLVTETQTKSLVMTAVYINQKNLQLTDRQMAQHNFPISFTLDSCFGLVNNVPGHSLSCVVVPYHRMQCEFPLPFQGISLDFEQQIL